MNRCRAGRGCLSSSVSSSAGSRCPERSCVVFRYGVMRHLAPAVLKVRSSSFLNLLALASRDAATPLPHEALWSEKPTQAWSALALGGPNCSRPCLLKQRWSHGRTVFSSTASDRRAPVVPRQGRTSRRRSTRSPVGRPTLAAVANPVSAPRRPLRPAASKRRVGEAHARFNPNQRPVDRDLEPRGQHVQGVCIDRVSPQR